ncbi:GntR family transcriptional regulator [Micromonospora sp. NPDC048930]|uniref:GntR family transcriptional regulator n=1 Tax=Micromonospora sp. NPDC048930 TaxID=3364261 RepID=UPI003710C9C9
MVDPRSDVPAWKQLAALMRARIESGEWAPGSLLPPQQRIGHEHGVGKATVEQAVRSLRAEGLIDLERGIGLRVREPIERKRVAVPRGSVVRSRMPTPEERADLGIPEGVPVMVVIVGGRERGPYPADRVDLTVS